MSCENIPKKKFLWHNKKNRFQADTKPGTGSFYAGNYNRTAKYTKDAKVFYELILKKSGRR